MVPHIVPDISKCGAGTNVGPYFCGAWLLAQRAVRELASSQLSDPKSWGCQPLLQCIEGSVERGSVNMCIDRGCKEVNTFHTCVRECVYNKIIAFAHNSILKAKRLCVLTTSRVPYM